MKQTWIDKSWKWCGADFLSPKDFLRHALLILFLFGVMHVAGLREYTSFLNGTTGSVNMNPQNAVLLGLLYLVIYMATLILVPILFIAAAVSTVWNRYKLHQQTLPNESGTTPPQTN